jgi:hypothetical protein
MMNLRRFLGLGAGVLAIATAVSACVSGSLVLPTSQCDGTMTYCGDGCVDTQNDPRNCGACGKTCNVPGGEACVMGVCGKACSGGSTRCGAVCTDLQTDRANCGACGKACLVDEGCVMGKCAKACQPGLTACPRKAPPPTDAGADAAADASGDAATDAGAPFDAGPLSAEDCVDLKRDPNNCGACGSVCPADKPYCDNGTCKIYTFFGIRTNLDPADLASVWQECYTQPYNGTDTFANILNTRCTKANLMLACRQTGQKTLIVAAEAPRADVTFEVGSGTTASRTANGAAWYFSSNTTASWGFAVPNDGLSRTNCDTFDGVYPEKRLCWHSQPGGIYGGYRCGTNIGLNSSTAFERVVLHAD